MLIHDYHSKRQIAFSYCFCFLPNLDQHAFYPEITKGEKSTSATSASHKMANLRCLGNYYLRSFFPESIKEGLTRQQCSKGADFTDILRPMRSVTSFEMCIWKTGGEIVDNSEHNKMLDFMIGAVSVVLEISFFFFPRLYSRTALQ